LEPGKDPVKAKRWGWGEDVSNTSLGGGGEKKRECRWAKTRSKALSSGGKWRQEESSLKKRGGGGEGVTKCEGKNHQIVLQTLLNGGFRCGVRPKTERENQHSTWVFCYKSGLQAWGEKESGWKNKSRGPINPGDQK